MMYGVQNDYGEGSEEYRPRFQNPGSALRRSGRGNPRNLPCPTCGKANKLTPADVARHYQCDECADRAEGLGY